MTEFENTSLIQVENQIHTIRDQQVMLDRDLAKLLGVKTNKFNEQIKRNSHKIKDRHRFQLTKEEWEGLNSSQNDTSSNNRGLKYLPYAFTELGCLIVPYFFKNDRAMDLIEGIAETFFNMKSTLKSGAVPISDAEVVCLVAI